jgi:cell division protein FtsI/penicillin-binding protein 2
MAAKMRSKKTTARKTAGKTTPRKTAKKTGTTRKYSRKAGRKVELAMREMKEGKLKSGRSGKKVTNPKQAVAIGLSEARQEGDRVPDKR